MYEIDLSNDIKQIELEINHHKNIAGQSIWEIGRRLNYVKENDLAHGQFTEWIERTVRIHEREAQRMMKIANELPKTTTLSDLGTSALYLIATLPDDQKQAQLERVEQGDNPTVRELQQLKRELNVARKANESLREKNEDLAEQILSKQETKIIEKEVVVEKVPDDYKETKKLNETLLNRNKELQQNYEDSERRKQFVENQLQKLYDEREQVNKESERYKELTEAINASKGQLNETQAKIGDYNNLLSFLRKGNNLLTSVGGVVLINETKWLNKDAQLKQEFEMLADGLNQLAKEVNNMLKEAEILEGELL